jgi:hypothetical protein
MNSTQRSHIVNNAKENMFAPDRMLATSVHANEHSKLEDQKERWNYRGALLVGSLQSLDSTDGTRDATWHASSDTGMLPVLGENAEDEPLDVSLL